VRRTMKNERAEVAGGFRPFTRNGKTQRGASQPFFVNDRTQAGAPQPSFVNDKTQPGASRPFFANGRRRPGASRPFFANGRRRPAGSGGSSQTAEGSRRVQAVLRKRQKAAGSSPAFAVNETITLETDGSGRGERPIQAGILRALAVKRSFKPQASPHLPSTDWFKPRLLGAFGRQKPALSE
jgi:hypothetical protein